MSHRARHSALSLMAAVCVVGCDSSPVQYPITTSLLDLSSEHKGSQSALGAQREFVSLGLGMLTPDVGYSWIYPSGNSRPSQSIGLIPSQGSCSAKLTVTGPDAGEAAIMNVKVLLLKTLDANEDVVQASLQFAKAELAQQVAGASADTATKDNLKTADTALQAARQTAKQARETYQAELAKPENRGIIVARWTTASSSSESAAIGSIAKVAASQTNATSGYVILTGVRQSCICFGEDLFIRVASTRHRLSREMGFWYQLATALPAWPDFGQGYGDNLGFTTYVLQAKRLECIASRDITRALVASIDVNVHDFGSSAKLLQKLDKISLAASLYQAANLEQSASVADFKWETKPFPMVYLEDKGPLTNFGETGVKIPKYADASMYRAYRVTVPRLTEDAAHAPDMTDNYWTLYKADYYSQTMDRFIKDIPYIDRFFLRGDEAYVIVDPNTKLSPSLTTP